MPAAKTPPTQSIEPNRPYRMHEVNAALAVGRDWCQLRIKNDGLPAVKTGGLVFVLGEDLLAWLKQRRAIPAGK